MEDRCRVIHHTKGIDCSAKLLFSESRTNVISKARPYEEHLLASPYPKPRVLNINNGSEFHPIFNLQFSIFNLLNQLLLICKPVVESVISTNLAFLFC